MVRMTNTCPGTAVAFEACSKDGGATMASGTSDELRGRVIGIGAARLSADDAQIALIEELRRNGSCGGPDRRCEAEAAGKTDRAVGKIKQEVEKVIDQVKHAIR